MLSLFWTPPDGAKPLEMYNNGVEIFFAALILAAGIGCAWIYLWRPAFGGGRARPPAVALRVIGGDRPWRRLGAGIFLLVSVMFVLGVALVDIPDYPRAYAAYWTVILGLVLWLCALAIKDVRYTMNVVQKWRAGRGSLDGSTNSTDSSSLKQRQ